MSNGREFWEASIAMTSAAQRYYQAENMVAPYEGNAFELTFLLYCHNNEAHIAEILARLAEAIHTAGRSCEIVVVDDQSKDATAARVRSFIIANPQLVMVLCANRHRKGLTQSYIDAAFTARGKYLHLLSSEAVDSLETLIELIKAVGEADIIAPYYISATKQENPHWVRYVYTGVLNALMRKRMNDYGVVPMHLRYNIMRWHSNLTGEGFHADLLCRLLDLGFTCKQLPCRGDGRVQTLPHWRDVVSMLCTVIDVALRKLTRLLRL